MEKKRSEKSLSDQQLEKLMEDLYGISEGENSEDGNESDENDEPAFNPSLSNKELLDLLENEKSSDTHSQSFTGETVSNSPSNPDLPADGQATHSQLIIPTPSDLQTNVCIEDLEDRDNDSDDSDILLSALQAQNVSDTSDTDDDTTDDDDVWKRVPFSHEVPIDNFDTKPITSANFISNRSTPLVYFKTVFSDEIMLHILEQTNVYATQEKTKDWEPVTQPEIQAFIGMLILIGIHPLPNLNLYWSSDPLFRVTEIADIMTAKRFKQILKCLHLNDNSKIPKKGEPNYDKLYKIRPLLDCVNTLFQEAAITTNSQSIDECMIKFKGRSTLKQYMPNKPTKRGFKVWARCDSETGYLYEFEVYTGKKENATEVGLGAAVVKGLCKTLIEQNVVNIHVAFDNFFSSTELLSFLYENKIYATSTVRSNRKNLPLIMKNKKMKLEKGKHKWRVNGAVGSFVWMDTKLVYIMSTAFCPSDTSICKRTQKDGSKKEIACPTAVLQYTKRMGGVDRFDQKRGVYPVARRSRRWWTRIFYFLVDAAITNAHILHMKNPRVHMPLTNLQFRTMLGRNLVNNFSSRKRRISNLPNFVTKKPKINSRQKTMYGIPDELRLHDVGAHLPGPLPTYRRCRLCSSASNSKKSKVQCIRCEVPLCVVPCFMGFHMP